MASGNYEIRIEKLVYGGEGLGRGHGKVVFVPFSVPGDRLLVRSRETKKSYSRAEILRVIGPASDRRPPLCPYFGRCGGCQWQHAKYECQLSYKKNHVIDSLRYATEVARKARPLAVMPVYMAKPAEEQDHEQEHEGAVLQRDAFAPKRRERALPSGW